MEKLVEKAKEGDEVAFAELILSIKPILEGMARKRIRDEVDREDIIQNTLASVYKSFHTLEKNESFRAWTIRIFKNECYQFYKNKEKEQKLQEKYIHNLEEEKPPESELYFHDMISSLKEKEQLIFSLRFEEKLTTKQIANELGMKESTVKSVLSRGKGKIKEAQKRTTVFILILCILIATTVIAVSIISYLKNLFELNSMGKNNDGVLMAIEHLDWYQSIDMDYINLDNGYQIKAEYLLMDEMNLYMVLDITSEKDISKFTDISFPDLKITDEENRIIYDEAELFEKQYSKASSAKVIENNRNSMKVLVYMYTDNFPESKRLDISFSEILFAKRIKQMDSTSTQVNFQINLSENFINRTYTTYHSENGQVKKAIITETGFYAIVSQAIKEKEIDATLIDEEGNSYPCYCNTLNDTDTSAAIDYIILTDFNNRNHKTLTLRINDTEYLLTK